MAAECPPITPTHVTRLGAKTTWEKRGVGVRLSNEAQGRVSGEPVRTAALVVLALAMIGAGVGHFTLHDEFLAQTPSFLPARSLIVWASGVTEIALGLALLLARRHRPLVGLLLAGFLVLIFPGNVYQAVAGVDGLGLDTAGARWVRLLFQPPLVALALWCTGAYGRLPCP